jgi:hypothetical protein
MGPASLGRLMALVAAGRTSSLLYSVRPLVCHPPPRGRVPAPVRTLRKKNKKIHRVKYTTYLEFV